MHTKFSLQAAGSRHSSMSAVCMKIYIQDTKKFPKCCVGRNGKQNQQNYTYKCVDRSRHNRIKGAKAKCAH